MALINAFGALALDQSVMAATPLLKAINTTLQSTPYVYVVNYPAGQTQNVNVLNFATPQPVSIVQQATPLQVRETATPITYSYQPFPYSVIGTVSVSNLPGVQNVNVANPSTPPTVQNVSILSTPIVYSYQPFPYAVQGTVSVGNFPATQNVLVTNFATPQPVNIVQQATPIQVRETATPIVYSYQPFPYAVIGTVSVGNFPATQNVQVTNFATPQPVSILQQATPLITMVYSTPITYSYQPYPYSVIGTVSIGNFPATQNVQVMNFATPQPVSLVQQATPIQTFTTITSTPVTFTQIAQAPPQTFGPQQQVAIDGTSQPFQFVNIDLYSSSAGFQATPLVLGASRNIRVLGYAFTSSAAAIVTFCATPIMPTLASNTSNFQWYAGLPATLRSTANIGGPFNIAANGGVSYPANLDGPAFQAGPSTPLYIASNGSNVTGHLTFVYV